MQVDWKRIENVLRHNVYDESQHPRDAKGSDTGGQWTSTGGGKMSHLDKMKAVVYKIAEAEKFPKDRIEFDPDPSAVRLPNGKTFERLAYYSHEDKKIHFCPLIMKGKEDALAGVVAHEINHTKYDLGAVAQGIKKTIGNDEWDKKSWSYLKDKDGVTPYSKMIWDNADHAGF